MPTKTYEINFLEPSKVHFARTEGALLRLTVDDLGTYPLVKLYRAFPLSAREEFISVRDAQDKHEREIGLIEELDELSAENRELVDAELHARYFVPSISQIRSVVDSYGILEWDVETDRGRHRFTVKDVHERIRVLGEDHFLIVDTEECRYEITSLKALPLDQQRLFLRHFYR